MSGEQRLNSVERFRKQPGRLVLEEHGHCEVPAGCGGVVLRWRNPNSPLPVTVSLYAPVEAACSIDGAPLQTGKVYLAPGPHAVAVALADVDLSAGLIMFAATHDPKEYQPVAPGEVVERPLKVVTEADGTWKFTLRRPAGDDWLSASFDDQDWDTLSEVPTPNLKHPSHGAYACSRCRDQGASCLGLPAPPGPVKASVWIRKVFQVPAPQFRGPTS
jgi:hypothetical protein